MRFAGSIFPEDTLQLRLGGNRPNFSELGQPRQDVAQIDYERHDIDGGRPLTQQEFRDIMREIIQERGPRPAPRPIGLPPFLKGV
jgi:hypothetical protein